MGVMWSGDYAWGIIEPNTVWRRIIPPSKCLPERSEGSAMVLFGRSFAAYGAPQDDSFEG